MFDPFKNFETAGYLRNARREKRMDVVKKFEHMVFKANINRAFSYLSSCDEISYRDFLFTHQILFSDFYPWAGTDRSITMPKNAVKKGNILFSHPNSCQLAIEHGLRLGNNQSLMQKKPGEVMGIFAYGHPFLDGNGRVMLLVHMELCHRAGFGISWENMKKDDYLKSLGNEIMKPGEGVLDSYLSAFKGPPIKREI